VPSHYRDSFRQVFYLRRFQSVDAWSTQSHGPAVAYACRAEPLTQVRRAREGDEPNPTLRLFTEVEPGPDDLLYPPGADKEDAKASRKVLSVAKQTDFETGQADHFEVYL
jgi:hypothetical protein